LFLFFFLDGFTIVLPVVLDDGDDDDVDDDDNGVVVYVTAVVDFGDDDAIFVGVVVVIIRRFIHTFIAGCWLLFFLLLFCLDRAQVFSGVGLPRRT
jgi:hypothetical protein